MTRPSHASSSFARSTQVITARPPELMNSSRRSCGGSPQIGSTCSSPASVTRSSYHARTSARWMSPKTTPVNPSSRSDASSCRRFASISAHVVAMARRQIPTAAACASSISTRVAWKRTRRVVESKKEMRRATSNPPLTARSRARALSLPPDHINAYLPFSSVPLRRLEAGLEPVDEGSHLCPVLGLASLDQIAESLGLDREQRLGAGAGVADERVMHNIVIVQSRVAGQVLEGRPRRQTNDFEGQTHSQPRQRSHHGGAQSHHHQHVADGAKCVVCERGQQVEAAEMNQR